jgi:hypothetical protein
MKKFLLPILMCSLQQVNAQITFSHAMHDNNEGGYGPVLTVNNGIFFFTRSYDATKSGMYFLHKFDHNGNQIFRTAAPWQTTAGMVTLDGKLLYAGADVFCGDVITNPRHAISVARMDTSGNVLQMTSDSVGLSLYPRAVVQLPDSTYRMFTDSAMYVYSKTLQLVTKTNAGHFNVSAAIEANGNILMARGVNGSTLQLVSPSGSVISSVSMPAHIIKILPFGGNRIIALADNGQMYRFTAGYALTKSSALNFWINDFTVVNDSIYVINNTNGVGAGYAVLDTNFTVLHSSTCVTNNFVQSAISGFGSKMAIIGSGAATQNVWNLPHVFSTINVINKTGNNNFQEDLKVMSIGVDSSYSAYFDQWPVAILYLRPRITVKNTGVSPIAAFKVNFMMHPSMSCGIYVHQEEFTQLTIPPGGTMTVSAKKFAVKTITVSGASPLPRFETFCFYTTVPNGQADKTYEDNEMCGSFGFIVTSLNDRDGRQADISVYPVPATSYIEVKAHQALGSAVLLDLMGREVADPAIVEGKARFDLSDLPPGIYFVRVEVEKGMIIKKVIKE